MLNVDTVRIGEVLSNLLSNALRHTPSGGSIAVKAEPADGGGGVAFVVADTGSGIPAEELPHVFDRFVKSKDSGGVGLGLAIARTLAVAHGGSISVVDSTAAGTTMRFVLPVAQD